VPSPIQGDVTFSYTLVHLYVLLYIWVYSCTPLYTSIYMYFCMLLYASSYMLPF